jgi:uncharacterized protein
MTTRLPFWLGCLVELALLAAAAALSAAFAVPLFADLHWNGTDLLLGIAATGPLLLGFRLFLVSNVRPLRRIRDFLESAIRPALGRWSMPQLAIVSVLAGICEETLFRSVLQGGLHAAVGAWPALLLAATCFGLCHSITRTYAVLATVVGIYLGAIWLLTGNLLVPIVAHAVYDFVALTWFLKCPLRRSGSHGT